MFRLLMDLYWKNQVFGGVPWERCNPNLYHLVLNHLQEAIVCGFQTAFNQAHLEQVETLVSEISSGTTGKTMEINDVLIGLGSGTSLMEPEPVLGKQNLSDPVERLPSRRTLEAKPDLKEVFRCLFSLGPEEIEISVDWLVDHELTRFWGVSKDSLRRLHADAVRRRLQRERDDAYIRRRDALVKVLMGRKGSVSTSYILKKLLGRPFGSEKSADLQSLTLLARARRGNDDVVAKVTVSELMSVVLEWAFVGGVPTLSGSLLSPNSCSLMQALAESSELATTSLPLPPLLFAGFLFMRINGHPENFFNSQMFEWVEFLFNQCPSRIIASEDLCPFSMRSTNLEDGIEDPISSSGSPTVWARPLLAQKRLRLKLADGSLVCTSLSTDEDDDTDTSASVDPTSRCDWEIISICSSSSSSISQSSLPQTWLSSHSPLTQVFFGPWGPEQYRLCDDTSTIADSISDRRGGSSTRRVVVITHRRRQVLVLMLRPTSVLPSTTRRLTPVHPRQSTPAASDQDPSGVSSGTDATNNPSATPHSSSPHAGPSGNSVSSSGGNTSDSVDSQPKPKAPIPPLKPNGTLPTPTEKPNRVPHPKRVPLAIDNDGQEGDQVAKWVLRVFLIVLAAVGLFLVCEYFPGKD